MGFTQVGPDHGQEMHDFLASLFPLCRSLTGDGVRRTLEDIRAHLPGLVVHEIPSGARAFDWTVPDEWNIRSATLTGPDGQTIVDFQDHNLHVVNYSIPVDAHLSLEELEPHLYSLPHQPDAIPYVTSYYEPRWGFCLPHRLRATLKPGRYHARIDSTLKPGSLTLGELILPGETDKEIFLSTCICHPSLANNELSGPVVTTWLAKWIAQKPRKHTYRIVFIPETIGAVVYLSRNLERMRQAVVAGFNVSCVGDDRNYSYMASRHGDTLADRVARHVLDHIAPDHKRFTFRHRGSDERQYCAPGVDLPVCSVMRSKFFEYPEYHTSLDDLTLVTPSGLAGGYEALRRCLECLESNETLRTQVLCEPQLGKRQLYPGTLAGSHLKVSTLNVLDLLAYGDGKHDLLAIAELTGAPMWELMPAVESLKLHGLLAP